MIGVIVKMSREIVLMEEAAREQFNFKELTLTQMHYLETISQLRNPNLTELSSEMSLTKPTVKIAIDRLIEKDLIYRVRSDEDRRSTHLHLTEKGKLINQMHDYAHRRLAELMIKNLTTSEREELVILLDKIFNKE